MAGPDPRPLQAAEQAYDGAAADAERLLQEQHQQQLRAVTSSNSLGGRETRLPHEVVAASVL